MADDRLNHLLQRLDVPVTPGSAFADSLYQRIAPLALAAGRRDRTWYGRVAAAVRWAPISLAHLSPVSLRTVLVAAMLLALLLALAVIIGSRSPDPNLLVRRSEAVYLDPPAFDMTVAYDHGELRRFRFDGEAVLRVDAAAGSFRGLAEGSYILTDVTRVRRVESDRAGRSTSVSFLPCCLRPLHELDLRWGATLDTWNRRASNPCRDWEYVDEAVVAGRVASHVRCAEGRHEEYWVDVASGFILRSTDVPTEDREIRMAGEVLSLVIDEPVDATAMQFQEDEWRLEELFPGANEPYEPGTRVVWDAFRPSFAATPGDGWFSWVSTDDVVSIVRGHDPNRGTDGAGVWVVRPTAVTDVASGRDVPLAPGPEAILDWLRRHPYFEVGEVEPTRVGSRGAMSLPIREVLPDAFDSGCQPASHGEPAPTCLRWFPVANGYFTYGSIASTDYVARAIVVDVNGSTVLVLTVASGPDMEAHLDAVGALLASIEFLE